MLIPGSCELMPVLHYAYQFMVCVCFQSAGVPRSPNRQRPMWSLRCCLLTRTFKVRSLTHPDMILTITRTTFIMAACLLTSGLNVVSASLRSEAKKTKVKRKTNNPQFEEVFYFEVCAINHYLVCQSNDMCTCWVSAKAREIVMAHEYTTCTKVCGQLNKATICNHLYPLYETMHVYMLKFWYLAAVIFHVPLLLWLFRFQEISESNWKRINVCNSSNPHEQLGQRPTSGPNNSKNSELTRVLNNSVGTLPHRV